VTITVSGPLLRAPEIRSTGAADTTVVILTISLPGLDAEVRVPFGPAGPAARVQALQSTHGMNRGDPAVAVGAYMTPRFDHGDAVLCLREVSSVIVAGRTLK
jgi:hypothetical protein